MSKKISVIIPVYNVKKYLRRCVDSVLTQTFENLEIILVDDGSPDGCPHICDEYAERDSRVTALHKKNGGQSSARNAALDCPLKGDFVTFVDSDDWIEQDTYKYCMDLLEKYDADCVQYEINLTDSFDKKPANPPEEINVYSDKDVLQYFMLRATKRSGGYSMCGGIFQRSLIEGLRFREGKINEDIDFKYKLLERSKRMVVTNQIKYNYFQQEESTSTGGLRQRDFQLREAADLLCELSSKESYGNIAFLGKVKKARTAFSLLSKIAYYGVADQTIDKKETVKKLTKEHRKNVKMLLKAPLPLSRKALAVMFAVNYPLTEKIIRLAKRI